MNSEEEEELEKFQGELNAWLDGLEAKERKEEIERLKKGCGKCLFNIIEHGKKVCAIHGEPCNSDIVGERCAYYTYRRKAKE